MQIFHLGAPERAAIAPTTLQVYGTRISNEAAQRSFLGFMNGKRAIDADL